MRSLCTILAVDLKSRRVRIGGEREEVEENGVESPREEVVKSSTSRRGSSCRE